MKIKRKRNRIINSDKLDWKDEVDQDSMENMLIKSSTVRRQAY